MRSYKTSVKELVFFPEGNGIRITLDSGVSLQAGQYLLASTAEDILPTPLFACKVEEDTLLTAPAVPGYWQPGTRLDVRGPLGNGFCIPAAARCIALAGFCDAGHRLLPLMRTALKNGQTVTFFLDSTPSGLPQSVEVLPLDALAENLGWADYLAIDLSADQIAGLANQFHAVKRLPYKIEALVRTPLPCGGGADCGMCSVRTKNGIRHACVDGPIFNWAELAVN